MNSHKRASDFIIFDMDWYTNFLGLPNLVGFLEFHKYTFDTITTDFSVFDRFCFLCVENLEAMLVLPSYAS